MSIFSSSYQLPNKISGEDSREANDCYRAGKEAKGVWVWGRHSKSVAGLGVTVSRQVYKWKVKTGMNIRLGRVTGKQGGAMQCKCGRVCVGYCWGWRTCNDAQVAREGAQVAKRHKCEDCEK